MYIYLFNSTGGLKLETGEGCIAFEDFLNMMSIMGPSAPLEVIFIDKFGTNLPKGSIEVNYIRCTM